MLHQNPGHCKHEPTQFEAGFNAFKRGALPQTSWPQAKREGWNFAGEMAYLEAMADELEAAPADASDVEYLPVSDAPGYSESRQPFLW